MQQYTNVLVIKAPTDYWRDIPDELKHKSDLIIEIKEDGYASIRKDKHWFMHFLINERPTIDSIINTYNIPLESVLQLEKIKSIAKE